MNQYPYKLFLISLSLSKNLSNSCCWLHSVCASSCCCCRRRQPRRPSTRNFKRRTNFKRTCCCPQHLREGPTDNWTGVAFTTIKKQCKFCPSKKTKTFKYTCASSKCQHQNVCLIHSKLVCKTCWTTTDHGFE